MRIFLGNLKLSDIVKEEHLETVQAFLDENGYKYTRKCDDVDKAEGNYHIYDMPRQIHICGEAKLHQFVDFLKEKDLVTDGFKGRIGVAPVTPRKEEQSV